MAKTKAELEAENAALRADLATIGRIFNQEAEDADLCDAYDEAVSAVNAKLQSDFRIPPRGEEHEITVDLKADFAAKVKVFHRDEYDAADKVRYDMTTEEIFRLAGLGDLFDTLNKAGFDLDADVA